MKILWLFTTFCLTQAASASNAIGRRSSFSCLGGVGGFNVFDTIPLVWRGGAIPPQSQWRLNSYPCDRMMLWCPLPPCYFYDYGACCIMLLAPLPTNPPITPITTTTTTPTTTTVTRPEDKVECSRNRDCRVGKICVDGQCVWDKDVPQPTPTPGNSRSCLTENHCESGEECVRGKCAIENGEVTLNEHERAILYRLAGKLCRDSDKCFKQFVNSLRGNKDINLCEELKQSGPYGEENSQKKEEERQREFLKMITESKEKLVEAAKIVWRVSNEEYHKSEESKHAIDTILEFVGTKQDFFVETSMLFINFVMEASAVSWEKPYEKGTYWFPTPDGEESKPIEKIRQIVLDILNPTVTSLNTDVIEKDVINYIKSFIAVTSELVQGPNPTEAEMI